MRSTLVGYVLKRHCIWRTNTVEPCVFPSVSDCQTHYKWSISFASKTFFMLKQLCLLNINSCVYFPANRHFLTKVPFFSLSDFFCLFISCFSLLVILTISILRLLFFLFCIVFIRNIFQFSVTHEQKEIKKYISNEIRAGEKKKRKERWRMQNTAWELIFSRICGLSRFLKTRCFSWNVAIWLTPKWTTENRRLFQQSRLLEFFFFFLQIYKGCVRVYLNRKNKLAVYKVATV